MDLTWLKIRQDGDDRIKASMTAANANINAGVRWIAKSKSEDGINLGVEQQIGLRPTQHAENT